VRVAPITRTGYSSIYSTHSHPPLRVRTIATANDMIRSPMDAARRTRGSVLLYFLAFALLIVSAYLLFEGNPKASLKFVWWSVGVSIAAILFAVVSLVIPRR